MASYILTDEEVKSIVKQAHDYLEIRPNYRKWFPVKEIPDGYTHEWYIKTRVPVPQGSKDGRDYKVVQPAYTTSTANITSYRYGFSIPRVQVEMARQQGKPIWADAVASALRQMEAAIAHLILEGGFSWDPVAINGLRDGGTDVGAAPDDDKWNTVTNPLDKHLAEAWSQLNTNGVDVNTARLIWVMSSNLAVGLKAKYGAGDPSQEELTGTYNVAKEDQIYLPLGTSTEGQIYPIAAATADDGVWFVFPYDEDICYLAEVFPPKVTINPKLNERDNAFEGYIEWRGTVAIVQATGIIYFPEVDLA